MNPGNIGKVMNSITEVVIEMYDKEELSREAGLKSFTAIKNSVEWREEEVFDAVEAVNRFRCGNCLKKMNRGERFYSILDATVSMWNYKKDYGGFGFCPQCFDKMVKDASDGKKSGREERDYIEKCYKTLPQRFTV